MSALRLTLLAAATLLVGTLLAGCAGGDCTSSSDCSADQICQAGACADRCQSNNDCEANRICRAGVCELLPRCNATDECASGEVCEAGVCRPQTAECDGDSDCPPNFTCFEGGCYAPGTEPDAGGGGCVACANGETCIEGECVRVDAGRDAAEDADVSDDADVGDDVGEDVDVDADADDADAEDDADADDADAEDDADADDAPDVADVPDVDDADTVDVAPDADADAADADTGCRGAADCEAGQICIGGVCSDPPIDVVEDTTPDTEPEVIECVGTGTGQLGDRCTAAANCCSDLCFGTGASGVCTEACGTFDDCNPREGTTELFCYTGGGPETRLCAESVYLDACTGRDQCLGGVPGMVCRIPNFATGLGRCTWQCGATDECRGDSACGPVDLANGSPPATYVNLCTPVGTACRTYADCLSGLCLEDDEGPSYCTAFCDELDPNSCPDGFACVTGIEGTLAGYGACVRIP